MYITREEYSEYQKLKECLSNIKADLECKYLDKERGLLSEVSDLKNALSEANKNINREKEINKNGISLSLESTEYKDYISPYVGGGGYNKKYAIYIKSDDLSSGVKGKLSTIVKRIIQDRVDKEHDIYNELKSIFNSFMDHRYSFGLIKMRNVRKTISALSDVLTEYELFLDK